MKLIAVLIAAYSAVGGLCGLLSLRHPTGSCDECTEHGRFIDAMSLVNVMVFWFPLMLGFGAASVVTFVIRKWNDQ